MDTAENLLLYIKKVRNTASNYTKFGVKAVLTKTSLSFFFIPKLKKKKKWIINHMTKSTDSHQNLGYK